MNQYNPDALCQDCNQSRHQLRVLIAQEDGPDEECLMCLPCYDAMRTEGDGMTFAEWYQHVYKEGWDVNHIIPEEIKDGYEVYCEVNSLVPYYPETQEEEECCEESA